MGDQVVLTNGATIVVSTTAKVILESDCKCSALQESLKRKETEADGGVVKIDLSTDLGLSEAEIQQFEWVFAFIQNQVKEEDIKVRPEDASWKDKLSLCTSLKLDDVVTLMHNIESAGVYAALKGELDTLKSAVGNDAPLSVQSLQEKRKALQKKAQQVELALKEIEKELESVQEKPDTNANQEKTVRRRINPRDRDKLQVELQSIRYMCDQTYLEEKNSGKSLAYNLIVAGVTGTGKSSSLNTILDKQLCRVSGAQAQGTRGCNMQDGSISPEHFVSFIDTQGLGADTSITDSQLLEQIMTSTESVHRMGVINNILISFDLANRQTPSAMANQLTLMELFTEVRSSCFLILTKWNTNSVQAEWNTPLRKWTRKWRRAKRCADITEDPPSYHEMYQAYCNYIVSSMNNSEDGGSFSKMGTFLAFFEYRVLWMFNLDGMQVEDREDGELDPYILRLYQFYRQCALDTLYRGRKHIDVGSITFLRKDESTLAAVARELIEKRDTKIRALEAIGLEESKLSRMETVFKAMVEENAGRMKQLSGDSEVKSRYMNDIAEIAGLRSDLEVSDSDEPNCTIS